MSVHVIVFTRNRPGYLKACLACLAAQHIPTSVTVADGSDALCAVKNRRTVEEFSANLLVQWWGAETKLPLLERITAALEQTSEDAVFLLADDDFLNLACLNTAAQRLLDTPELASVHGYMCRMTANPPDHIIVRPYIRKVLLDDSPATRLSYLFDGYRTIFYSVRRRENLIRDMRDLISAKELPVALQEIMLAGFQAIEGKLHCLSDLFLIRSSHGANFGRKSKPLDLVNDPRDAEAARTCVASFSQRLVEQDVKKGRADAAAQDAILTWSQQRTERQSAFLDTQAFFIKSLFEEDSPIREAHLSFVRMASDAIMAQAAERNS
jgi:glycosyltransferase domain-containing protein